MTVLSRDCLSIALAGLLVLVVTNEALAASTDVLRDPVAGGGLLIAFAIAYLSRRRAIGGWLLNFYIQLYLSLAFFLIDVAVLGLSYLYPRQISWWYVMFWLSSVPVLVTEVIKVFAATRLLFHRNEQNLSFLRKTLVALVATSSVAVLLDLIYYQKTPAFLSDYLTFFFAIIWISYFWKARRVRLVFIDRSWAYTSYSAIRMLGPDEKKRLRKRALITAVVTFVVFLLIAGSSLKGEQKQLDISIFSLPLFYSFIAAVIAWYLPIRKKKPISVEDKMINTASDNRDTKT